MAKFGTKDPNADDTVAQPDTSTPAAPQVTIDTSGQSAAAATIMAQQTVQMNQQTSQAQAQASVGLAQTVIESTVVDHQIEKEDEHWVKAYWRPAMGWLYMAICFMDFVGFPLITMFLPVVFKGLGVQITYTPWQSLTLSNGGLIHLAFGAILGVTSFMRGQEKLAKLN
jgi:hypothetical protein